MQLANTRSRYGGVSQSIHWLTAALVIVLLISGKAGEIEAETSNTLYFWHSSLGITILILIVVRILWRFISPQPELPSTMSPVQRGLARTLHLLFYALLVAVPLAGWFTASAEGGPVTFFGLELPAISLPAQAAPTVTVDEEDEEAARGGRSEDFWEETHETLGNVLLILAILHVLAALKHHLVDKDDVFRRMWPGRGKPAASLSESGSNASRGTARPS